MPTIVNARLTVAGLAAFAILAAGCSSPRGSSTTSRPAVVSEGPLGAPELRATWVVASSAADDADVSKAVDELQGFRGNALFLQVRSRGDAYYNSSIEPRPARLKASGFDPLGRAIESVRSGTEVHAWVNCGLVANAFDVPTDLNHVVVAHPEWLSVPQALAQQLWNRMPHDPTYTDAITRYAKEHKNEVEGLFCDPSIPDYRAHVVRVVEDICNKYRIDGIHLDYIRYPSTEFGYGRKVLELFRREVDAGLSESERGEMGIRSKADPLAYARRYPARFAQFRRDGVTHLVRDVGEAARRIRPSIVVSAAVFPDIGDARDHRLQDWPAWLRDGALDAACPMIYSERPDVFDRQLRAAVAAKGRGQIWAGIGAWKLTSAEIVHRVESTRILGASGAVLFSHHGLRGVSGAMDALRDGPFQLRARRRPDA